MFEGVWEVTQNFDFLEHYMIFDRKLGSCIVTTPLLFNILKDISIQCGNINVAALVERYGINPELFFGKLSIDLMQYGIMKKI
jgi:hypothetical protein